MSVLVDRDIRLYCGQDRKLFLGDDGPSMISPFSEDQLQPASYDVLLGTVFLSVDETRLTPVDMGDPSSFEGLYVRHVVEPGGYYRLPSKGFVLACTEEFVSIPPDLVAILHGKSGVARLGQVIESAGFVDPYFRGRLTMELYNQLPVPIILRPGLPIAQLSFESTSGRPDYLYGDPKLGSHYQDSAEVIGSRYGT
jgi:dCTP deaminase